MDDHEYSVGPGTSLALIFGFFAFYGLLIAVALSGA